MKKRIFSLVLFLSFFTTGCITINRMSPEALMTSDAIKVVTHSPVMRDGKMFDNSKYLNELPSIWIKPPNYKHTKYDIDGLPVELLETKKGSDKVIMLLHGGAYIIKLIDIYRDMAVKYSKLSGGASVLLVDYRVTPEYTFPAALDDALTAWNWLIEQGYKPGNILVVGDSAGGNLALALALKLRDQGMSMPVAMICMSPWTDLASEGASYDYNRFKDPVFGEYLPENGNPDTPRLRYVSEYAGDTDLHNPYLSPAYAKYNRFPPMLIQVGTNEVLESDALTVYARAKEAGVDVTLTRYEGMFHVFQLAQYLPESKEAWKEVERFIDKYFKEENLTHRGQQGRL